MKTFVLPRSLFGGVAFAITLLTGCDLLNQADDVNFNAILEDDFQVAEEDEGTNVAYTQTLTLDATSDPDVEKYKSKISGFTVNKVTYRISNFTGANGATFTGTLSFGDASQSTPTVAVTINNLNLQQAYASGLEYELLINQGDVDKIGAMLKDDKAVKLYLVGTLTAAPVFADIKVFLDVSVKADAL